MTEPALSSVAVEMLVERIVFMLNALSEAQKIKKRGHETTSWRGQLGGFRGALELIAGSEVTSEILEMASEKVSARVGELLADELMISAFPRIETLLIKRGHIYRVLGQHDRALAEGLKAIEEDPTSPSRYRFLIGCYILLNRVRDAEVLIEEAAKKGFDSRAFHFDSYLLAFLKRDVAEMAAQVVWGAGKPGVEDVMLFMDASTNAFFGRQARARELSELAVRSAEQLGENELAAGYRTAAALREALFGNALEVHWQAESALTFSIGRDVQYEVTLALALAGDVTVAESLTDAFAVRFREESVVQHNYLPTLTAQLALSQGDPSKAIEVLRTAAPYELGDVGKTSLYPIFLRGRAFLLLNQNIEAAGEFQKILDHPGIALNGPVGVVARLGLARAYARQRDIAKAKDAYEDFLTLWKDADPDIPIFDSAISEYVNLQ